MAAPAQAVDIETMRRHAYSARSQTWRLYSGSRVIEAELPGEVARAGARRAFVICSRSVETRTGIVARIAAALGDRYAGCFGGIEVDSTYESTMRATEAARAAGADLLIAAGGGSVIVAVRAVDVFLCEQGSPFELMTQYPDGKPAYSPRLMAPKLPIINVVTTPTGAMNRAGTGLKNDTLDHRMEYFDPKTRPVALFWDWEALAATPDDLIRSTATTTFSGGLASAANSEMNPLVEADREQGFRLAVRAYHRLIDDPGDLGSRLDLCAAAFLGNRADDDGAARGRGSNPFTGDYALATALHVRYPHALQGRATAALAATVARRSEPASLEATERVATALGAWRVGMDAREGTLAAADAMERLYRRAGMPTSVRELNVPREDFAILARETVKNFNSNASARDDDARMQATLDLLEAAW